MQNQIDHFAIGAQTLEQGATTVQHALGVQVPRGSKHNLMSTHNCVAPAGDACFLEIIAIDPDAPEPERTRWFSLDDPNTQARLSERAQPLCWVVSTDSLDEIVSTSPVDLGEVVTFTRGDRSWRLTVPRDGSLPEGGLIPAFIEWSPGPHPSQGMPDAGITLRTVHLSHPNPDQLRETLSALRVEHLANVKAGPAGIAYELDSPNGTVVLD